MAAPRAKPTTPPPAPRVFADAAKLRAWLAANHDKKREIWIKYYKAASGKRSLRYQEALDEALCFGWIDGQVRSLGEESYMQRWTPRRKGSYWSKVNVGKAERLIAAGRMAPAGLAAFQARDPAKAERYSFEQLPQAAPASLEARLKRRKGAWATWQGLPPSYRKLAVAWIVGAKKEETRERRLGLLVDACARGERLGQLGGGRPEKARAPKRASGRLRHPDTA